MMFRQFATDALALITNCKHCGSDVPNAFDRLLHDLLTSMFWTVEMVPPVLVVMSVHADVPAQQLGPAAIVRHGTRVV